MDMIKEGIKAYLRENYDSAIYDIEKASETIRNHIIEIYIPDVIDEFLNEEK